jgi:hypothetical protein
LNHEQAELAFLAKDAAMNCVQVFLSARNFRRHLKCTCMFRGVFLRPFLDKAMDTLLTP